MTAPNIVVTLLDAARADHLSCYGYERETSPFIDELATNGDLYTSAYSNSIWSLPAYASMFTGEYPSEHMAVDWGQSINPNDNTLVHGLNEQGYETHAITTHLLTCGHGIADAFDEVEWVDNPNRLPYQDDPVLDLVQRQIDTSELSLQTFREAISEMVREQSWQTIPNVVSYGIRELKHATGRWEDNGAAEIIGRVAKSSRVQ
ncbi:sulfatase-like hydrolase/transferase [Haloarcula marismortui]|uniref:sulfatase-like hydrolase/transferase n=1 Tax=Haloarcula marismortui TaxID=2238 RepID=UPI003C7618E6